MRGMKRVLTAGVVWGSLCINARAQTLPSISPASAPARPRHVLQMPSGFKTITVEGHTALLEPADEAWVNEALKVQQPTTLPTTMPVDVVAKFKAQRAELAKKIAADLVMPDAT